MSERFYAALHKLGKVAPDHIHFHEDGDIVAVLKGHEADAVHMPTGDAAMLLTLLDLTEGCGLNWEISRKGRNPDNTWQYWATVWHPLKNNLDRHALGSCATEALALVLAESLT